jgi:hypothetical protein
MTFIQRIQPAGDARCAGHDPAACVVIDCVTTEPVTGEDGGGIHEAGAVVWHSHMTAAVHPEHRLNPDHPAEDHRGPEVVQASVTPWCGECTAGRTS